MMIIALCPVLCLYGTFWRADTIRADEISPVFDIAPSGRIIIFNSKSDKYDILFKFDRLNGQLRRLMQIAGSIEEICAINENQAVLSVRLQRSRVSSDIYVYLVNLHTGAMHRLTDARRVWEARIQQISSQKFIFRQHYIHIYLTIFGWEIYGLEKSTIVIDASNGSRTFLQLDTSPYQLEQILSDKYVIISFYTSRGKRWFLAELDKPLTMPDARVMRRQPLPMYSETLVASRDGRFFCYLLHDPAVNNYEIYCFDRKVHQTKKLVKFRNRIVQLKCIGDNLFFLSDTGYPALWQVQLDGLDLHKILDIGSLH